MRLLKVLMILLSLSLCALPMLAGAQADPTLLPTGTTDAPAEEKSSAVIVPESLATPRATLDTFLTAMNDVKRNRPGRIEDAISTLDLSEVNLLVRKERGEDLAWSLLEIIDRTRFVELDQVPDQRDGDAWVFEQYEAGAVRIRRGDEGAWRFDTETVMALPEILEEVSVRQRVAGIEDSADYLPMNMRIRAAMPDALRAKTFILENWQWLGLFVTVLAGVVLDKALSLLLKSLVRVWRRRAGDGAFGDQSDDMLRPLALMAAAVTWWLAIRILGLPEQAMLILLVAVKFLTGAAGVWAAFRLIDVLSIFLTRKAAATVNTFDDILVSMIPKTLKIFVAVIGAIVIAENLNLNVSGLLAGLGLGGLAFALASKDFVQNMFGSVTVLLDQTFSVGDWVKVADVEGTVEEVGIRSTRIRTFYNSLVTLPNSVFITAEVDNMGKRRYRRLSTKFGIAYDTPPDRIEAFCEGIRELVRQHPYMRKDYYHAYLNGFGDSSLEIMVYVFWEAPDWATELRERHRFLLDCLRLARDLDVEYAFPTRTLYLRNEDWKAGEASGETPQDAALDKGRELARRITAANTGSSVPPPVRF